MAAHREATARSCAAPWEKSVHQRKSSISPGRCCFEPWSISPASGWQCMSAGATGPVMSRPPWPATTAPLVPLFSSIPVGTLFLELCTSRAGSPEVLLDLPRNVRIGVGVVDQKSPRVETPEEIGSRAERAISWFGPERVLLNPDCGFATFADSPITSFEIARAKLANLVQASLILRERYA